MESLMVIFVLWDDSLWQTFISKWGPSVLSLKLRPGPVWHGERNLAWASLPPSIRCSLTSRDTRRYWNDYVAEGLCRYPDVDLMINLGNAFHLLFVPPSSLFWLYFSSFIFSRAARTGRWLQMKVEVEREGEGSSVFQSHEGRQKEWSEERSR